MDRPASGLRLEAITPPRQEIMRIWRTLRLVDRSFIQDIIGDVVMLAEVPVDWIFLRTAIEFWDPQHAVFNFQRTELAPTIEEYTTLIQRPTRTTQGIFVPNPFAVIRSQLSTLLGIPVQEVHHELHQGWIHGTRIAWLVDWTLLRALTPSTGSYQRDACHGFLLLIFGTLLFPHAPNLIDGATAQVVLQAVGGHSYVEALLAETIRSIDYVREVRRGRMRGSPHLLQVWLLAHIRPFCSSHPFSYIADERSLIARLVPVYPPPERSFSEWRQFLRELTPARFLWVAHWNPGGPMITRCPGIVGVPLISHLGSTLIFPGQRFTVNGTLAPYNASTSPSILPTKSEHFPPHQQTWLNSIRGDRCRHSGPRPSRSREPYLQLPKKLKAPPKQPCAQSYNSSGRSEIGFAANSSSLA
ncbi:hypothetical protein CRG98_027369 [Punica granatum]|uniref:DUF7745 domain-containing protein n=1 Tax=Punica granatum TaxID=22663 RepID=A0A2I0J7M7_PUNGR|nr:hypothetical protein CRG98_027369 [Punica granatum]